MSKRGNEPTARPKSYVGEPSRNRTASTTNGQTKTRSREIKDLCLPCSLLLPLFGKTMASILEQSSKADNSIARRESPRCVTLTDEVGEPTSETNSTLRKQNYQREPYHHRGIATDDAPKRDLKRCQAKSKLSWLTDSPDPLEDSADSGFNKSDELSSTRASPILPRRQVRFSNKIQIFELPADKSRRTWSKSSCIYPTRRPSRIPCQDMDLEDDGACHIFPAIQVWDIEDSETFLEIMEHSAMIGSTQ